MENILVLQQISKKFGQQYALTDVSLTIKKGEKMCIRDRVYTFSAIRDEEVFKRGGSRPKFRLQAFRLGFKETKVPFFNAF